MGALTAFPYTQNLPVASNFPSQDVNNMTVNTNSIYNWCANRDHIAVDAANAGLHYQVNFQETNDGSGHPVLPSIRGNSGGAGFDTLYSSVVNTIIPSGQKAGELIYVRGGSNDQIILTGPGIPIPNTNYSSPDTKLTAGQTFLAGGLLLQYGLSRSNGSVDTVDIAFPVTYNNLFNVGFTILDDVFPSSVTGGLKTPTAAGFTVVFNKNTFNSFYWFAIGN